MISEKEIEKIGNRHIELHHMYLKYAMDSFVGALQTIKSSIKTSIIEDIIKKHPEVKDRDVEATVSQMVEQKIKMTIKIEFEG